MGDKRIEELRTEMFNIMFQLDVQKNIITDSERGELQRKLQEVRNKMKKVLAEINKSSNTGKEMGKW